MDVGSQPAPQVPSAEAAAQPGEDEVDSMTSKGGCLQIKSRVDHFMEADREADLCLRSESY